MKRLCFGTLMRILYQARNQKVTISTLCDAIYKVYGKSVDDYDSSYPGRLKGGLDNVPNGVVDAARSINGDDAEQGFLENVIPLVMENKKISVVRAIKAVIREDDNIKEMQIIGYVRGYEKFNILNSSTFKLHSLLASVFYYAIIEVANKPFKDNIKEIDNTYLSSFEKEGEDIFFENRVSGVVSPLKKSIISEDFNSVFKKIAECNITNTSFIQIYGVDYNNKRLRFGPMKEYILENIGYYINSRSYNEKNKNKSILVGSRALIRFMQAYKESKDTVLGDVLLYIFLEEELNAPKIMTKIEIDSIGGFYKSVSDGVHLLTLKEGNILKHELVFGASNVDGNLKSAVDLAFKKIIEIEKNCDNELKFVSNTLNDDIFDKDTTEYMIQVLKPTKVGASKPDMSFGIFLGYTFTRTSNANMFQFQLKKDAIDTLDYIKTQIAKYGLEEYNFYIYVVPFNNASEEKSTLIAEMIEGR